MPVHVREGRWAVAGKKSWAVVQAPMCSRARVVLVPEQQIKASWRMMAPPMQL